MILKNEFEKAEIYLKESFRLVNNLFGDQSIQSASIKNELGLLYLEIANFDKALEYFNEAFKIFTIEDSN